MKSMHYMAIFFIVVAIVGGYIVYNARTIEQISDHTVSVHDETSNSPAMREKAGQQKNINVMKDEDIEQDEVDVTIEEDVDMTDVADIIADETISF